MLQLFITGRRCSLESSMMAFGLLACVTAGCARPEQERVGQAPQNTAAAGDPANDDATDPEAVSDDAGVAIAVVDAATQEPIPSFRVLAGTRPRLRLAKASDHDRQSQLADWQPDSLRTAENGADVWTRDECGEETMFRIEADGYEPRTTHWIGKPKRAIVVKLPLIADAGVSRRILQPDGGPAVGATVALLLPGKSVSVENGVIRGVADRPGTASDRWRRPTLATTDNEGRFRLPAETDPRAVVLVVHTSGTIDLGNADFRRQPEIRLKPWGRIEGRVQWKDKVGAGERIGLTLRRGPPGYPSLIGAAAETRSDEEGKFVFDKLPPGQFQISRLIELSTDDDGRTPTMFGMTSSGSVSVQPGPAATAVLVGGQGRTVVGRLTGRESWENVRLDLTPKAPPLHWQRYRESPAALAYRLWRESPIGPLFFRTRLAPQADGSFALAEVLPGEYQLSVFAPSESDTPGLFPINVAAERWEEAPAAIDVGEIEIKIEPKSEAVLPERFAGDEIIARVGPEVILADEVLRDASAQVGKTDKSSDSPPDAYETKRALRRYMAWYLDQLIESKLVTIDGRRSLSEETWAKTAENFNQRFDKEYLPQVIAAEECQSTAELESKLRAEGSSLEILRRQALERSFSQYWLDEKAKTEEEISEEEARDYYRVNQSDYESPARARGEHLSARFKDFDSEAEAREAIERVRLALKDGSTFARLPKAARQNISSGDDPLSWTDQGSLVSEVLDRALFTLPIGELSEVLEDPRGFHLIRVVERTEATTTSFADAEPEIRQKIADTRRRTRRSEYQAKLRESIPVWNLLEEAGIEISGKPSNEPMLDFRKAFFPDEKKSTGSLLDEAAEKAGGNR